MIISKRFNKNYKENDKNLRVHGYRQDYNFFHMAMDPCGINLEVLSNEDEYTEFIKKSWGCSKLYSKKCVYRDTVPLDRKKELIIQAAEEIKQIDASSRIQSLLKGKNILCRYKEL